MRDGVASRISSVSMTEPGDDPVGELRADALDQTRAQVALDALFGLGRDLGEAGDAQLRAELGVGLPLAAHPQARSHGHAAEAADDRLQRGLALHPQPGDRELAVSAVNTIRSSVPSMVSSCGSAEEAAVAGRAPLGVIEEIHRDYSAV